ncbi:MAG: xanthine dehydrogenase family protein subunit M [Alphaproteobacteria bacterium]|nr:xanthine dehydrogenase family protein subunit M [Alphaproteobacteria bacterium]
MKPARFTYHDPAAIADALTLLAENEDSRLLAGGQSLMPMMNFRFVQPAHLIDLNPVQELSFIHVDAKALSFGAMTRQRQIQNDPDVRQACPIILEALSHVGHRQTRARGTIGGSISHFDPSAELCNMAALHDAEVILARKGSQRTLTFDRFGIGYLTTAIEPDELLREVRLKRWPERHGYAFEEFAMRHGDFAICAVSCLLTLSRHGTVDDVAIAVSGVAPTPQRLKAFEISARGQAPGHDLYREAATQAAAIEATSDAYTTADYRRHLARILTYRAMQTAVARFNSQAK